MRERAAGLVRGMPVLVLILGAAGALSPSCGHGAETRRPPAASRGASQEPTGGPASAVDEAQRRTGGTASESRGAYAAPSASGMPGVPGAPASAIPRLAPAELNQLRDLTHALAAETWEGSLATAASFVDAAAAVIDRARELAPPTAQPGGAPGARTEELRAAAERLRRLDPLSLERAAVLKEALAGIMTAVRELLGGDEAIAPSLKPWLGTGQRAVAGIDPDVPLGLQQGNVQDAIRAVADSLAAAFSPPAACP